MPKLTEIVQQNVRPTRARRGWTQQDLADRCEKLGYPIDRTTIARIEKGDRNLSVDDVFLLAAALGCQVVTLMTPRDPDDNIDLTPTLELTELEFRGWIRGVSLPEPILRGEVDLRFFFEDVTDQQYRTLRRRPYVGQIQDHATMLEFHASEDRIERVRQTLDHLEREIERARDQLDAEENN